MIKRALLINPPTGLYVREDRCQSSVGDFIVSVTRPPMDLMMMASSLESVGVECRIRDYPVEGGGWRIFRDDFLSFDPDLLILSTTSPTLKDDLSSCAIAKKIKPLTLTVAKGAHFLKYDRDILESSGDLDIIIRGENEFTIKEIVSAKDLSMVDGITYRYNGLILRNKDRDFLADLDDLPFPARHLVHNELYVRPDTKEPMAILETSRGCPGNCIFCLVGNVAGKKVRKRSVKSMIDEIRDCVDNYNICNFHFKSDTFTWDKNWLLEICGAIINNKLKIKWLCNSRVDILDRERVIWMKRAGCFAVGLGIESGSQVILDKIRKGITLEQSRKAVALCKEFGIKAYAYFIIGFPWDTEDTINDSVKFALELKPDFVDFFMPYPFPSTELERIAKEYNLINDNSSGKAYAQPIMNTLYLSKDKLLMMQKNALRQFYMRPVYILNTLFSVKSPKMLVNYMCQGIKAVTKLLK